MRCFHVVCMWTPLITHCSLSNKCTQQTAIAHMLPYVRIMQRVIAGRGAKSRTWARGQLKYDRFPVLWTPKQMEKMLHFCPNYDVISKNKNKKDLHNFFSRNCVISQKKKVFTDILTFFSVKIRWSQKKKVFRSHMLISQCHFDWPLSSLWAHWSQRPSLSPWAPPKSMGSGVIVPLCPPSQLW